MRRRDQCHRLTLAAFLLVGLASLLGPDVAAADPDFTGVSDILGGRRYLLRVDDVVVVDVDQGVVTATTIPTSNSTMSSTQVEGSFAIGNSSPGFSTAVSQGLDVAPLALGRVVNLPRDVFVSLLLGTDSQWHLFVTDAQTNTVVDAIVPTGLQPVGLSEQAVVLADFDGDGYVEPLIAYLGQNPQGQLAWVMRVVRPANVNDLGQGVTFGPELALSDPPLPLSSLKTGDVNGDGFPEILGSDGGTLSVYTVSPATLQITGATTVSLPAALAPFNLIAGRFRNTPYDDVVVAGQVNGGPNGVTVYSISGDPDLALKVAESQFISTPIPVVYVFLARGPLTDWFSGQDLLVAGVVTELTSVALIFSSDQDLNFTLGSETVVTVAPNGDGGGCLYGLAVGNFDNQQSDGQHNPALQIATLWRRTNGLCSPYDTASQFNPAVRLWSVTPPTPPQQSSDWLTLLQNFEPLGAARPSTGLVLAIGDTQGRALVLGAPERVTVLGDIHPDIVLGIPPMHIDWIDPVIPLPAAQYPGCDQPPAPCQLNLTVLPSVPSPSVGFSTQYSFTSSASTQASRKSTTSWSLGVKATAESKVSYGVPFLGSVSVDIKASAGFTHDGTVAKAYNTYTGITDSLSATTGFADHLFFTQRRQNIYNYPIIGHTTCPQATPDCPASAQLPLYVSFSGPDQIFHSDLDATTLEWYQPVHEPGNVFSYPWSLEQLQQAFGSLSPLTTSPAPWRGTDTSQTAYTTTWTGTTQQSTTTGSVNAESASVSTSVAASAFGVSGSVGVSLNQSTSVSTLNAVTQTLSASTGIQVNKPVFPSVVADTYLYDFGGYVFGLQNPVATLQTINLSDQNGQPIGIQSTGPLMVGFVADPLQAGLPWWRQAYSLPDVGLNHPERWDWSKSTQTASFNAADASVPPQDQGFYQMKGFFVTPADANGAGPNRSTATAGEQLQLAARVYNFSPVDTDDAGLTVPAASIHVRFYGQAFDTTTDTLIGSSFLIGETEIGVITGFNSPSTGPGGSNWTVASVPFDTTPYPDVSLVFWVVVWMEDAQGNLVPETPDHGLTASPATATFTQITDVPVEPYSNNVGLYGANMPFYIAAPGGAAASLASGDLRGGLSVGLSAPGAPVLLDEKARVTAELRAHGGSLDGVPVAFYDGDPGLGGKLFDVRHVAHLRADEPHLVRAFLRPQTCGPHTIVVVAGVGTAAPAEARATVDVSVNPVEAVRALIATLNRLDLPPGLRDRLGRDLTSAQGAFEAGRPRTGMDTLLSFLAKVRRFRGSPIPEAEADRLIGQALPVVQCLTTNPGPPRAPSPLAEGMGG